MGAVNTAINKRGRSGSLERREGFDLTLLVRKKILSGPWKQGSASSFREISVRDRRFGGEME